MRRARGPKPYPYLTEYIQYAIDWHPQQLQKEFSPKAVLFGLLLSMLVGTISTIATTLAGTGAIGMVVCAPAFGLYMLGMYAVWQTRRARKPDPQRELRREAKQVAQRLAGCAARKRLHRDLSVDVASLLEEASRNWNRARSALESPYWRSAELPSHLRIVREQSLQAIDQGMQELLVLFATSVPERAGDWSIGEIVDEVVGHDIFATRDRIDHLSPFYDQGREVAFKLRDLADQVEGISRQLAGQELITGAPKPGTALEATLAELRQIKQAEDELRQDIRG